MVRRGAEGGRLADGGLLRRPFRRLVERAARNVDRARESVRLRPVIYTRESAGLGQIAYVFVYQNRDLTRVEPTSVPVLETDTVLSILNTERVHTAVGA